MLQLLTLLLFQVNVHIDNIYFKDNEYKKEGEYSPSYVLD